MRVCVLAGERGNKGILGSFLRKGSRPMFLTLHLTKILLLLLFIYIYFIYFIIFLRIYTRLLITYFNIPYFKIYLLITFINMFTFYSRFYYSFYFRWFLSWVFLVWVGCSSAAAPLDGGLHRRPAVVRRVPCSDTAYGWLYGYSEREVPTI